MKRALLSALAVACAAGCNTKPPAAPTVPPGLAAVPPRLAYLCVTPGCEETQTAEINVRGSRRVAIKRILLSGTGSADFKFTSSEMPPFIVGGGSSFSVDVTYKPVGAPAPGEARLLVTYTDASPEESPDRLAPGEIAIPLVRRIVGEPVLTVKPGALQFGVVTVAATRTMPVRVANEGFGNLVLQIASADAGHPDVKATLPDQPAMGPDAGFDMPIAYTPSSEGYLKATVTVTATAKEVPPAYVVVEGTSLTYPKLALEQSGDVDFGLVAKTKTRNIDRQLVNQGGVDLVITAITVADALGDVKLLMPAAASLPITLKPLQRIPLAVLVDGVTPGDVDATITFASNDPTAPMFVWRIIGTVTDPRIQLAPTELNFGNPLPDGGVGSVPHGWVVTRPLEIKNVGYGPLTIKNIITGAGTSPLFTLSKVPTLPAVLERDQRIGIDVSFRAETIANFPGFVSVESDDGMRPFTEVALSANVGMCGPMTCPISNGTPTCASGGCEIGMCNTGWYNTDGLSSTGCECKEPVADPGEFCMDKNHLGNFSDSGSGSQYTGIIALANDVDLISFTGEDTSSGQLFGDDYDVKISLSSPDPNIRMCVYRNSGRNLPGNCFFSGEQCPSSRFYRHDGSYGSGDDSDYIVKVFRDPGSPPTCTPYTVFVSNAR